MLSYKPSSGFHTVLRFNYVVIAFALLMTVTAFGASALGFDFMESFTQFVGQRDHDAHVTAMSEADPPRANASAVDINVAMDIPNTTATPFGIAVVPIVASDTTGLGVSSFQICITNHASLLEPASPPYDTSGTLTSGWIVSSFNTVVGEANYLVISGFTSGTLTGSGTFIKLRYNIVAANDIDVVNFNDFDTGGQHYAACALNGETAGPCTGGAVIIGPASTPTNTQTSTPTGTATNTPTATPLVSIDGTVTYGNAIGTPTPRYVSNVTVASTSGSPSVTSTTDPPGPTAGHYQLTGFGSGSYTITPSKTGGHNSSINSFDAAKIAQHVAGISTLTGNALVVADVSNNASVTSFDAAEVANFAVAASPVGITATWKFSPANRTYTSVTGNTTGQDYSALLMGEVSGNWNNTGARPARGPERSIALIAQNLVASTSKEVVVPINVEGAADKVIISYEFDLRYDPTVIQLPANPVDLTGTVSRGLSVVTNAKEPGLLKIAVYGPIPIDDDGVLLNLRFMTIGLPGSVSPLAWEHVIFNEGSPAVTTDGQIAISVALPNSAAEDR